MGVGFKLAVMVVQGGAGEPFAELLSTLSLDIYFST